MTAHRKKPKADVTGARLTATHRAHLLRLATTHYGKSNKRTIEAGIAALVYLYDRRQWEDGEWAAMELARKRILGASDL